MALSRIIFLSFTLLVFSSAAISASPKECIEKVSPKLVQLFETNFPKFRVPQLKDLDQESINFDLQDNRDGCYAVAASDFDGDKKQDIAILLTSKDKNIPHLIVALQRGESWKLYELPTFCDELKYCYVKPQKPGTYMRSLALDGHPTRADERIKLTSRNTSVLAGKLESTGIVYVYSKGRWHYVWVSD